MMKTSFLCCLLLTIAPLAVFPPRLAAQNPASAPHQTFDLACDLCHSTENWKAIKNVRGFDHGKTDWRLDGEHANVACSGCHAGGGLDEMPKQCSGCHRDPHRAELGTSCDRCHVAAGWRSPLRFLTLHETTRFPLTGVHRMLECKACHANQQKNEYLTIDVACAACHRGTYNATVNPKHTLPAFSLDCDKCHDATKSDWKPATYTHEKFPLLGAHATIACAECHKGSFSGTSVDCYACHTDDYQRALSPNHVGGKYSTNCAICHTTTAWKPATFNHDLTGFRLVGGHALSDCKRCHTSGQYSGLSPACISCHRDDYNAVQNPKHASAFPETCENCHTINSWKPATFDHSKTQFPLTGAHTKRACTACHVNGKWTGLATDCYSCHQKDYTRVTSPNHSIAQFPRDCMQCHTTSAWKPSTFLHDPLFPVFSGKHRSKWTRCDECHRTPSNYKLFSCVDCHEHAKSTMDNKHREVRNYTYVSSECFRCHPKGEGD